MVQKMRPFTSLQERRGTLIEATRHFACRSKRYRLALIQKMPLAVNHSNRSDCSLKSFSSFQEETLEDLGTLYTIRIAT